MLMLQFLWFWDDLRHPGSQQKAACCWPMGCSSWWMLGYGNWQLATAGGELVSMLSGFITPCDCVQATSHITGKVPTDFVTTMCQNCYRIPETFSPSNSCSCCFITIYYLTYLIIISKVELSWTRTKKNASCAFVIFVAPPVLQAHLSLQTGRNATGPRCRSRGISHLPGTQMVNLPWEIDDLPSYKPPFIRDFPWLCSITRWYIQYHSLVGGWPTPLKNMSQLGLLFPIDGKIKFMFQTTSQLGKFPGN